MRGTREKTPRCTSIKVRFGCVSLLTEWLILGDRTEAADYTKLWNDLRESISFVKGGRSQPCTTHVWTRWWLRRSYTYSVVVAVDMDATVFKKDPLGAALGNVYKNKVILVGGSQDETESLW
ncbi:hypothetical protein M405DRAFT_826349, partial [Rhizopogon salebrosus TDB-379]